MDDPEEERNQTEAFLVSARQRPAYGMTVLKLVTAEAAPPEVRQAAAVEFKNFVKKRWQGSAAGGLSDQDLPALPDSEKEPVKGHITSLMLSLPPLVRAQMSEALTLISGFDFPQHWRNLLPELCERLTSKDDVVVNGVLDTANSIFKRYRNQFMTEGLSNELEYCQQAVKPLLAALKRITGALPAAAGASDGGTSLKLLLSSARLVCRVFYSLNSPGLTEEFENTLDDWMAEFHTLLTLEATLPPENDKEKETELDAMKAAVAANINLFMEMNEEEFAKYLQMFVQDVWVLLTKVSLEVRQPLKRIMAVPSTAESPGGGCVATDMLRPKVTCIISGTQDGLAMNAIRFLTTVAKSVHHQLFRNEDALRQVCENIVIPNTRLRDDVEEMFENDWVEYVRRDTEGSDTDTRRRAACELVRALTDKFPAEVTQLFTGYVGSMLAEYAAKPAEAWQAKDCAVYLVTALAARGRTAAAGATSTNELVHLGDFYRTQIAPELQSTNLDEASVLKADALKFLTTFRAQIPKAEVLTAFPGIVRLLSADSNVVHSYAAICIERLLSLKDGTELRFAVADLQTQLEPLLNGLFSAFKKPESGENEYVMKCVMRLIAFVGPQIAPVAPVALKMMAEMLLEVCKNPKVPGFNHFLFESIAVLIRFGTEADASMLDKFQEQLFPAFEVVLKEDVEAFHPYVFQIFAQLIELRQGALPAVWMQVFPPLLSPQFWERPGNVPPLVRLLQAYLEKAPGDIVSGGHLEGVLGVFQKLLASKAHDHEGFFILNSLTEFLPLDTLRNYLPTIWTLLFRRLESARTAKYQRGLVVFLAFFVCKHGGGTTVDSIDALQASPPLSNMILQSVWVPTLPQVHGDTERRLIAAASARLLTEVPRLQEAGSTELWGKLLHAALAALSEQANGDGTSPDDDVLDVEEFAGYSAAYAQLHNAHRPDRDPLPEVPDAKAFLAQQLAAASTRQPQQMASRVAAALPGDGQAALQTLLQGAGVVLS